MTRSLEILQKVTHSVWIASVVVVSKGDGVLMGSYVVTSQQCYKAFQQAKDKLLKASVFTHYNPTKKLATDASAYVIGTVFCHTYNDGLKD